ncbi:hypothetical protein BDY21DRAFT_339213 [Lineolata rhizophorae]|uniref:Uncharacterized protein n=1 Tax=Lineolata rhizophorae TaxID=578093 RepID=A0A6A6P542_9PEZI|nr:hypothetical protein BDY21DRAFT_339213 [Lineolata rhizophorae]
MRVLRSFSAGRINRSGRKKSGMRFCRLRRSVSARPIHRCGRCRRSWPQALARKVSLRPSPLLRRRAHRPSLACPPA